MPVKKSILLFLFMTYSFLNAQSKPVQTKTLPTNTVNGKSSGASTQNLVLNLMQDTCLDKKFSVVFYLMNDSLYSLTTPSLSANALATYSLGELMNVINTAFKPICVQFEHCKTVIIPDWQVNYWTIPANGANTIKNYYEKNVINVYLPWGIEPIQQPDIPEDSYTFPLPPIPHGTFVTTDAIVIPSGSALTPLKVGGFRGSNFLHVLGHYFGLPHTYFEKNPGSIPSPPPPANATPPINTLEYVDHASIQNCLDHGDGFCDTEADPYPSSPTTTVHPRATVDKCEDAYGLKDGHGDFYVLPTENFMSHYKCRCKFSQQQLRYMAYIIMTRRLYLH